MNLSYRRLTKSTLADVVCLPGGLELVGKELIGDIEQVAAWRQQMLDEGLQGVIVYSDESPRGFAEFMPAAVSPTPIMARGAAVLLCYHWAGTTAEDPQHLSQERKLVQAAVRAAQRAGFSGMATLGWDHPTHFPVSLLEGLGFREIAREEPLALMWKPFQKGVPTPSLAQVSYKPVDLSALGVLSVEASYSTRCPYSIHHTARLERALDEHPKRSSIRYTFHEIDTREQALTVRASPCDWWWVRFNGEEIDFSLSREQLNEEIDKRLPR